MNFIVVSESHSYVKQRICTWYNAKMHFFTGQGTVHIQRFNENHQQGELLFPGSWFIENIKCCFKCSADQNNFKHQFEACPISSTTDEINFRHRSERCPISSSADYNNFQH